MMPPSDALLQITIGIILGIAIGFILASMLGARRRRSDSLEIEGLVRTKALLLLDRKHDVAQIGLLKRQAAEVRADHDAAVQGWEKTEAERDALRVEYKKLIAVYNERGRQFDILARKASSMNMLANNIMDEYGRSV